MSHVFRTTPKGQQHDIKVSREGRYVFISIKHVDSRYGIGLDLTDGDAKTLAELLLRTAK